MFTAIHLQGGSHTGTLRRHLSFATPISFVGTEVAETLNMYVPKCDIPYIFVIFYHIACVLDHCQDNNIYLRHYYICNPIFIFIIILPGL